MNAQPQIERTLQSLKNKIIENQMPRRIALLVIDELCKATEKMGSTNYSQSIIECIDLLAPNCDSALLLATNITNPDIKIHLLNRAINELTPSKGNLVIK